MNIRRLVALLVLGGLVAYTAAGCSGGDNNPKIENKPPSATAVQPAKPAGGGPGQGSQ